MSLQSFIQVLLVLVVLLLAAVVAGIIGYGTAPDPTNPSDPAAVQAAKQAALTRGALVFTVVMTLGLAVMGMFMGILF
ncbi:hypothetical protein [Kitasatospora sp. NPDC057500]|uniref:hypothetical protein n=1 Tax=Kitasatospora sp. NPDC057500 TaxID=3346151 RepID=UPI0036850CD9